MNAKTILDALTLKEKIRLLSGRNFWYLYDLPKYDLKSIMVTDGPHGLRKQKDQGDQLGLNNSQPATCFPTASALASSWDKDLIFKVGEALGEECLSEDVSVLLGPGINIKRHPLCGRNFEYFSEDPILSGKLATAMIQGVQSKGIGTSLKHFAVNNQEAMRMVVDVIVDERTLRELYLKGFEMAVKDAQPWTVMSSYNKVNGTYASEHKKLLQEILKDEWGHQGLVVTDWGANNNRVQGIMAGQNLEMPGHDSIHEKAILKAINDGKVSEELLDKRVLKVIELIIKGNQSLKKKNQKYDVEAHHQFARKVAGESMVLLKNDKDILPINKNQTVALIGAFAKHPRYQGSGSSLINPTKLTTAYDAFHKKMGKKLLYAPGYDLSTDKVDETYIKEAIKISKRADVVVIMAGLTDQYESEGFDREHLNMPKNHDVLIQSIVKENPNVIVTLSNGSPVLMPWMDDVKAIIEQYLAGQASGEALADIIFGDVNPSGKLAETFPNRLEEIPSNKHFPGKPKQVEYREGLFVGYRAYDKTQVKPLFPFGYGLSYTKFELFDIKIKHLSETEKININVKIKNIGEVSGKEVIQVYVGKNDSLVYRPIKELKAFKKVEVGPQETESVSMEIDYEQLKIYQDGYQLEDGRYQIYIGTSVADIVHQEYIDIDSSDSIVDDQLKKYKNFNVKTSIDVEDFEQLLGHNVSDYPSKKPYTLNSTMLEIKDTLIGRKVYRMIAKRMGAMTDQDMDDTTKKMIDKTVGEMPLRSLVVFSRGAFSLRKAQGLLDLMNKKFLRGLFKVIFSK